MAKLLSDALGYVLPTAISGISMYANYKIQSGMAEQTAKANIQMMDKQFEFQQQATQQQQQAVQQQQDTIKSFRQAEQQSYASADGSYRSGNYIYKDDETPPAAEKTASTKQAASAPTQPAENPPPAETRSHMYMPSMGGMPAMVFTPFLSGYTGVSGLMDDTLPQFIGNPSSIRDQDNHNRRMFMYQQAMSIMQQFWAAMSQLVKSNDDTKRGMARNL